MPCTWSPAPYEGQGGPPVPRSASRLYFVAGVAVSGVCDGTVAGVPSGAGVVGAGLLMVPDPAGWFIVPPRGASSVFKYMDANPNNTIKATAATVVAYCDFLIRL